MEGLIGPQTASGDKLHAEKYRQTGEGFREAMNRIANGLKDNDQHYQEFRDILLNMRFSPGGRIQNAIGADRETTAANCYASAVIQDSFVDGQDCIMDVQKQAVTTLRMGGGIGYDFSTLRPKGDPIKKLGSHTDGPLAFMHGFDAYCGCVSSAGHRRGAQMGVLRIDHPDIVDFIHAKQSEGVLTRFNISVAITDEFMEAVGRKNTFDLRFNGQVYRTVDANELFEQIMRSTYDWADPGVIFIDRMNEMNNLWYCEKIYTTNPCSEQPLPPHGACILGSFNLVKYLRPGLPMDERQKNSWYFDWDQFMADIPIVIRAMDNVIDKARYPLPQQREEAISKRRMGLGIMGLANAGEALGFPYASSKFLWFENKVLFTLKECAYVASANLAKEKGPFKLYDEEKYLESKFIKTLSEDVRDFIKRNGIRNSHLTSIAPTGTISLCADNISSGIEPVFAHTIERPIKEWGGTRFETIEDYGYREFGIKGRLADDLKASEHISALITAQKHVDSAVSKTINMDGQKMTWEEFKDIYITVHQNGGKGCTTFNRTGKKMALLTSKPVTKEEELSCKLDLATGRKECA